TRTCAPRGGTGCSARASSTPRAAASGTWCSARPTSPEAGGRRGERWVGYPQTVGGPARVLHRGGFPAGRGLATALLVALSLQRPVLLEGEVGVGKTEVAKVLAAVLGRKLIRLQCYEGIDTNQALYEWDYARQMLYIRALSERQVTDQDAVDQV